MTGIYVRIRRDDGSIDNVEVDQLSDAEMDRFAADQMHNDGWRWVKGAGGVDQGQRGRSTMRTRCCIIDRLVSLFCGQDEFRMIPGVSVREQVGPVVRTP